jgi:hypothetical protein
LLAPVGIVAVAFGGFAVAEAASGSSNDSARDLAERSTPTTATSPTTSTSLPDLPGTAVTANDDRRSVAFVPGAIADGATQTFSAGAAGTVTINRSGLTLTVVATTVNPGWTREIERGAGPEVEVVFTNGTTRIDLEAEFEDGEVRVRIRERTADNSGPGSASRDGDDDRFEDRSGSGHSDDSGTSSNSGPRSGRSDDD